MAGAEVLTTDVSIELSFELVGLGSDQRSLVPNFACLIGPSESLSLPYSTQLLQQNHILIVDLPCPAGSHIRVRLSKAIPETLLFLPGVDLELPPARVTSCLHNFGVRLLGERQHKRPFKLHAFAGLRRKHGKL